MDHLFQFPANSIHSFSKCYVNVHKRTDEQTDSVRSRTLCLRLPIAWRRHKNWKKKNEQHTQARFLVLTKSKSVVTFCAHVVVVAVVQARYAFASALCTQQKTFSAIQGVSNIIPERVCMVWLVSSALWQLTSCLLFYKLSKRSRLLAVNCSIISNFLKTVQERRR